jgi:2-polyprenyl-6-methoxyphenol hydroxylase-like FAD-dependent oxidoreductase
MQAKYRKIYVQETGKTLGRSRGRAYTLLGSILLGEVVGVARELRTQCCIVGCGPAGAMLGLLLARQGVDVVVLEKHGDFLRDFRGDDMSPSTMEILDELGLASGFLDLGPKRMPLVEAHMPDATLKLADLSGLRTRFPYVAVLPQWDFLDFIAREASRHQGFHLLMNAEATGLVEEDGQIRGVRYRAGGDDGKVLATLTVAADGRSSVIRDQAGLQLVTTAPTIDLLWFRLPRPAGDPDESAISIYMAHGRALGRMNRGDYWQIACVIPKDSDPAIRAAGLDAFRESIRRVVPDLAHNVDVLQSWDQVSLLSVQTNRLRRWHRPGLLCIGDAAHAMSPIGGAGINYAIQDAVVAANRLAEPIRRGRVTVRDLAGVQRERAWQVRAMQALQSRITKGVLRALEYEPAGQPGILRRLVFAAVNQRGFCALRSRIIGLGFRRVHVAARPPVPVPE